MLMNYHEMTMNEPRDSPARRKQFLLICTVMAGVFCHSMISSGALDTVVIKDSIFPGGDYIYKFTKRDYAASNSLCTSIADDLELKPRDYVDAIYTTYLDDPSGLSGRQQRFACGYLVTSAEGKQNKKKLMEINKNIVPATDKELLEDAAFKLWPKLPYQTQSLPSVNAAVVQFPFTNGFVSALIHSYKVIPALRKYAAEHGVGKKYSPVVISTCSAQEQMCTHYAPLYKSHAFLLGQEDSETYRATVVTEETNPLSLDGLRRTVTKLFPFLKNFL